MKKRITVLFLLLAMCLCTAVCFAEPNRLDDKAGLLTEEEQNELIGILDEISQKQSFDIVVATRETLDGKDIMDYADDFYDYSGYNHDGCVLLLDMDSRKFWISTSGYGITALTDNGIDYLKSEITPFLSSGDYCEAFSLFANLCDTLVDQAKDGKPYNDAPPVERDWLKIIVVGLAVGCVLAFIPVSVMKSSLNSARLNADASDYYNNSDLNISESQDVYLYSNVTRVRKEKSSSSSTHTSSSGNSHGGGGGSF